jgi:hypothetical protein
VRHGRRREGGQRAGHDPGAAPPAAKPTASLLANGGPFFFFVRRGRRRRPHGQAHAEEGGISATDARGDDRAGRRASRRGAMTRDGGRAGAGRAPVLRGWCGRARSLDRQGARPAGSTRPSATPGPRTVGSVENLPARRGEGGTASRPPTWPHRGAAPRERPAHLPIPHDRQRQHPPAPTQPARLHAFRTRRRRACYTPHWHTPPHRPPRGPVPLRQHAARPLFMSHGRGSGRTGGGRRHPPFARARAQRRMPVHVKTRSLLRLLPSSPTRASLY